LLFAGDQLSRASLPGIAHAFGVHRSIALVTALAVAAPACAHDQQLTNRDVATGVVAIGALVGLLVLYGMIGDCEHKGTCTQQTP
jgi:hypothetical protein